MSYTNVNNIAEADLAGCLDVVADLNNFELLRDNLTNRIALYILRERAYPLRDRIMKEAAGVQIPIWENVINELQYEFRLAAVHGQLDKMNHDYESQLINQWAKHIAGFAANNYPIDFIYISAWPDHICMPAS